MHRDGSSVMFPLGLRGGGFGSCNIEPPRPNDLAGIDLTPTPIPAAKLRMFHTRQMTVYIYIYIYVYIYHHHVVSPARISLTLSGHFSLSFIAFGRSSRVTSRNPHIAAVCMFELVVLLLLGHLRWSIGVHHWWVRPCFSNSVLRVWFV